MHIASLLHRSDKSPFDEIDWDHRKASITDDKGATVFVQDNAEVPKSWSMLATNVVASKYFHGGKGSTKREHSVRQLVHRVTRTIADWGISGGYFSTPEDGERFYNELSTICLNQYGSFNSPVWFNVGLFHVYGYSSDSRASFVWDPDKQSVVQEPNSFKCPQASACFIQSVEDTMEDIMRLAGTEAILFKYGSGTGTDLSTLRSTKERLSGGGTPSGPLSFMRVYDQVAAVVKSGGKTRRAAKMQSLKIHHPDILDFIQCKSREEKKAWSLIEQGYDGSFGGEAYESVMFQNANLSVRLTDAFMQAVEQDKTFQTLAVTSGKPVDEHKAREVFKLIAEGTHLCGDPGVQYDTTVNRWHTCPASGRINASNPCSEFMFVDNSACNLSSMNLMKFIDESGAFDVDRFRHVVRILIIAQEILVDSASYPTREIAENSHRFRPLGLGYANLGALLMRLGMPYDSDEGRGFASTVTALMSGHAYATSQELARAMGTFDAYEKNRDGMLNVMRMHREALHALDTSVCPTTLRRAAEQAWDQVLEQAPKSGFRNSQVTLLAPTGTIGFMMDCDTTGVEPDIALVKYKQLAGGGLMKLVNRTIQPALICLGYSDDEIAAIIKHIDEQETIEGAPGLKPEHLPVFDCAFKPKNGTRYISYRAHLRMMAAVQPFLSGAISKTINMPQDATVNDIMQAYMDGWKLGLKAVAIYRDGSKRTQPLNTSKKDRVHEKAKAEPAAEVKPAPFRRRMSATRQSLTHKFEIAGHEGYLTVGMYEDGTPGELFITMAKEGSTVGGLMDSFGTAISLCLQYGVPVTELCMKFAHSRFEPSGFTKNPDIPIAKSIVDYIFRWLSVSFPGGHVAHMAPLTPPSAGTPATTTPTPMPAVETNPAADHAGEQRVDAQFQHFMEDAPACDVCGAITVRNGACYRCYNCGNSMGCS
ncbi:MAG: ribonucleoside-diphosphate reductase, adenosylcobalamin-dependent [Lentisphaerae bacterium RIFOXYC12_FULL_60_16]|nr:MAG: ribonucleoside-diphosphate reductase, adenosylcobalamin-dependent [Lentisphaerae bacterium RIFOXYC12_FULL_60_16]OGV86976.1 MAG: ribonucleoside-diphosphate reductase, adenosylcobalamin-dependent [Lentisphaerae bacterium RIFOXYB12_FULL_60_10]